MVERAMVTWCDAMCSYGGWEEHCLAQQSVPECCNCIHNAQCISGLRSPLAYELLKIDHSIVASEDHLPCEPFFATHLNALRLLQVVFCLFDAFQNIPLSPSIVKSYRLASIASHFILELEALCHQRFRT